MDIDPAKVSEPPPPIHYPMECSFSPSQTISAYGSEPHNLEIPL
jgi:hypothetical protein